MLVAIPWICLMTAAVRQEQLAELRARLAVGVALYAVTPSDRTASARRVMPSSICSGVTPE